MTTNKPYHEGELFVQDKLGVTDTARMNGSVISNLIPGGALNFIAQQSMVVLGSVDTDNQIWTSVLFGTPGFINAQDASTINIDLSTTGTTDADPLWRNIETRDRIGMIVIELGSRRRLRVNGRLNKISSDHYQIKVEQAYPNCPQYIQRRHINKARIYKQQNLSPTEYGRYLNEEQRTVISKSDTFFVSSAHPDHGVDTSHRGGQPGFIEVVSNNLLQIPDYPGNSMFNTLGNFQVNPHAGLVFIDFVNKKLLQLTGRANVLWNVDSSEAETAGTLRYWQFTIESWIESDIAFDIEWEYLDASPFNPVTSGNINPEEKELRLSVERITQQSPHIKSFKLVSRNGNLLPKFDAGAHLQVTINHDNGDIIRHYSILSHPDERRYYEIAVLEVPHSRGGSFYMHRNIKEGDELSCSLPISEFPLSKKANHNILIAGGIGITPMLSMLQRLISSKQSVEIHYTAKNQSDLIFTDRIKMIAGNKCRFYASIEQNSRLDLKKLLAYPKEDTHIYVCGPVRMINSVRELGEINNWSDEQIHYESFGTQTSTDIKEIQIYLEKSHQSISIPANKSILDCLLEENIDVPHQCKRGECGMCTTTVLDGQADHHDLCLSQSERKHSMCLCVSRAKSNYLKLDL